MSIELLATLLLIAIALVALVAIRPGLLAATPSGRLLGFVALFVIPIASIRSGVQVHMEGSKTVTFCMSCHEMEPYGQSLLIADDGHLPAGHFQNRRIDRETACFTCHTQYTMFGDLTAKMNGLRHLWVHFTNQVPEVLKLYAPYNNRECLHCHIGSRRFDELHADDMTELVANRTSCITCHGPAHDIAHVEGAELWKTSLADALAGGPID